MIPFTHELLSQYVGTSREIVTHYMNQFRRQGYLRYSRKRLSTSRQSNSKSREFCGIGSVEGIGIQNLLCNQISFLTRATVSVPRGVSRLSTGTKDFN
jgi:hypothetical protein